VEHQSGQLFSSIFNRIPPINMSEEGLYIDTGASIAAEPEHNSEEANQVSKATTAIDPESLSEGTDESPIFDDSDKTTHDLSPTTPYLLTPEHHGGVFEKINESPSFPEPVEPEPGAEKSCQEPSLSEETYIKAEHLNEEPVEETSILARAEAEHSGEEPVQDPSTSEPSKKDEAQYQSLSVPVETEEHIEDAPQHHETSITAEAGSSEEENVEEKRPETPESSIAGAEEASKEIVPKPSHSAKTEPDTSLDEEMQPPELDEKKLGESANKELAEPPPAETAVQESPAPTELKELAPNQTTEAPQEPPKPTPSDREKRALDVVKRSRYQFRVAVDIFLQLVNENEDDEGTIRLNLVERDSDLRKVVGMLGLKLQSLTDAERDLDWAQLLDRYEAKKEQE
jgi:hypothetical protein